MKTISDRIVEIKKELDELESHVNSTLSILDCKSLPLNPYPDAYKTYRDFKWKTLSFYENNWRATYKDEEETLKHLDAYKTQFDQIHESNKNNIEQNTQTFNKICDFFEKVGLSKTTWDYSGTGKNKRSYQREAGWVSSLRTKYPMIETEYVGFSDWHKREKEEIEKFWRAERQKEKLAQLEKEKKQKAFEEEETKQKEKQKATLMAKQFLLSNGKTEWVDYNDENAIDKAFELKTFLLKNPPVPIEKPVEVPVEKPKTTNAIQFMEIDE